MIMLLFSREGPRELWIILNQFEHGALLLVIDLVLLLVINGDAVAI